MDFVWLVQESDVWEPEIQSIWNNYEFSTGAYNGPGWAVGTDVDIVVGFVDVDGDVHLMRARRSVSCDF